MIPVGWVIVIAAVSALGGFILCAFFCAKGRDDRE